MRVFITGASSGIGAAMAKKFDAMGAQLGLVGRSQEKDVYKRQERNARLALCMAARRVLANGLEVLGVSAPERCV